VTTLFPYQVSGAQWLAKAGRGLLADEPGLGKTAQAIAAAAAVGAKKRLVLCPASVVENWRREIKRFDWKGHDEHLWRVESYDMARGRNFEFLMGIGYDLVICDEAHMLKTRDTKRTQAVFGKKCDGVGGLIEKAKHVFLLTGTPMPNNPSELWPMLRAVMPDALIGLKTGKPVAYWPFAMRYCKMERNYLGHDTIVGGKNLPELRERMKPFVLRRKKSDVLSELPPIRFDVLPLAGKITIPPDMADEVAAQMREVQKALEDGGVAALKAIAPHVATLRRLTGVAKVAPVIEWVKDQLDGGMGKIVLFAQHREVIENLYQGLAKITGVVIVSGSTTDRQAAVDMFQNDPLVRVFVGQIQAAGTGITLTAASDLVFVESDWVPSSNEQAAMRIHRISQKNACTVRFATIAGSIDEQIQRACARKLEDIRALFV